MAARLAWVALAAVAVAAAAVLLAWSAQRRLLYFPVREDRAAAERRAAALGLLPWVVDGELAGWRAPAPGGAARGRLVVLHGNAASALERGYFAAAFGAADAARPLEVLLVEYPGYGPRPGRPTEESLVAAARAALAAARRGAPGPVLLAGESLGSAVAALAAAEDPDAVDGLLLVTPLASVPAVAARHYGRIPAWFFRDPYRADLALPRYPGPVAALVAGQDEVVFADLGEALVATAPGPRRAWVDPGAGHNSIDWRPGQARWREMVELLAPPTRR